jgi:hypothetical protein
VEASQQWELAQQAALETIEYVAEVLNIPTQTQKPEDTPYDKLILFAAVLAMATARLRIWVRMHMPPEFSLRLDNYVNDVVLNFDKVFFGKEAADAQAIGSVQSLLQEGGCTGRPHGADDQDQCGGGAREPGEN